MTTRAGLRPALAAAVLLGLTACGGHDPAASPPPSTSAQPAAAGLVLRVEDTGGSMSPTATTSRLPLISVYADGRVLTQGPQIDIYPPPALPNLQEQRISRSAVRDLVDRALAAGVADSSDLGSPPIADATSTRFTVVTASHTYVREAYALTRSQGEDAGLTAAQRAARGKLGDLLGTLTGPATDGGGSKDYAPTAVAVLATPWIAPQDAPAQPEQRWPGPALPATPVGGRPDLTCATATAEQAHDVLTAARSANAETPWVTAAGSRWTVAFRPLLPDESSCADLTH